MAQQSGLGSTNLNLGMLGALTAVGAGLVAYVAFSSPTKPEEGEPRVIKKEVEVKRRASVSKKAARTLASIPSLPPPPPPPPAPLPLPPPQSTSPSRSPMSSSSSDGEEARADQSVQLVDVVTPDSRAAAARARAVTISNQTTPGGDQRTGSPGFPAGVQQTNSSDDITIPPAWEATASNLGKRHMERTREEIVSVLNQVNGHGGEAAKRLRERSAPAQLRQTSCVRPTGSVPETAAIRRDRADHYMTPVTIAQPARRGYLIDSDSDSDDEADIEIRGIFDRVTEGNLIFTKERLQAVLQAKGKGNESSVKLMKLQQDLINLLVRPHTAALDCASSIIRTCQRGLAHDNLGALGLPIGNSRSATEAGLRTVRPERRW
eukprot:SAG11_NODE_3207_length_2610_cov_2.529271_2_plen_377_part_00